MTQALRTERECPECKGPTEAGWIVCAECGASLGVNGRKPGVRHRESALPSVDSGTTAFVPFIGGAKRPITVVRARVSPTIQLREAPAPLMVSRRNEPLPSAPPTEDSRHRITVLRPDPIMEASAAVTDLEEGPLVVDTEGATPLDVPEDVEAPTEGQPAAAPTTSVEVREGHVLPARAASEALPPPREDGSAFLSPHLPDGDDGFAPGPAIEDPAVLEEAPPELEHPAGTARLVPDTPAVTAGPATLQAKRPLSVRIANQDLSQIQRMVDAVVRQRLRELVAAQRSESPAVAVGAQAAREVPQLRRMAARGAGLLLGAALVDALVLNWDVWVRGELVSSVGWVQQLGIIGGAALAGAGASAALIGAAWARRRRRQVREATRVKLARA